MQAQKRINGNRNRVGEQKEAYVMLIPFFKAFNNAQ